MLGSVVCGVAEGEAEVVGAAVAVAGGREVPEDAVAVVGSPPHPASNVDAASERASSAAEVSFTVSPTVMSGANRARA